MTSVRLGQYAGAFIALGILAWGVLRVNAALGRRTGEIDHGVWYQLRTSSGEGFYYQKGVDPDNRFADADTLEAMVRATGNLLGTSRGYGANWCQRGWLGDAVLTCSGWELFETEDQAFAHLRENGVPDETIFVLHR